jgi:hypothetical protein
MPLKVGDAAALQYDIMNESTFGVLICRSISLSAHDFLN